MPKDCGSAFMTHADINAFNRRYWTRDEDLEDTQDAGAFEKLEHKLSERPGVTDPKALAAAIGRKKLGEAEMARRSAAGRK